LPPRYLYIIVGNLRVYRGVDEKGIDDDILEDGDISTAVITSTEWQ
jgi:hypothetical protein